MELMSICCRQQNSFISLTQYWPLLLFTSRKKNVSGIKTNVKRVSGLQLVYREFKNNTPKIYQQLAEGWH